MIFLSDHPLIFIGNETIREFINYCKKSKIYRLYLISDENTFRVLGGKVYEATRDLGWDIQVIILNPEHLHTDDISISQVLANYDAVERLFISIGSGTITDITRFTSHKSRNNFVAFPTAASVDAYSSRISPTSP